MKLLTRLRAGFRHVKEHKFQDAANPLYSCESFVESRKNFFLHCTHFSNRGLALINKIKDIDKKISPS